METRCNMTQAALDDLPWEEVESSNIARVAWMEPLPDTAVDEAREQQVGSLYVEFHGTGRVYRYTKVRHEQYAELLEAESVGGYFNAEVKGSFEFKRVEVVDGS